MEFILLLSNADSVFVTSLLDLPCNVFVSKFNHNTVVSISVDIADIRFVNIRLDQCTVGTVDHVMGRGNNLP